MSSVSSRLGLELPDSNDPMSKGDHVLASNYRTIDKNMHVRYESDLANITVPYNGQFALDTDIDDVKFYNSGWKSLGSASIPKPALSFNLFDAEMTETGATGTPTKGLEISKTIVTGRRYRFTISGGVGTNNTTANTAPTIYIKYGTSATTSGSSDLFSFVVPTRNASFTSTYVYPFTYSHIFQAADVGVGTRFFAMWVDANSASTGVVIRYSASADPDYGNMSIEDIGV